jgi:hypothetical protein
MLGAIKTTSYLTLRKINEIVETKDSILTFLKKDKRNFKNPKALT